MCTNVKVQLVDRSVRTPRKIIEDVQVEVDIPIYLVVLDTKPVNDLVNQIRVMLDHPLFAIANALINCKNCVMKISFENMPIELNIFHISRKRVSNDDDICNINNMIG